MDAELLAPNSLRRLVDLRYRGAQLPPAELPLFFGDGLVDAAGVLTPRGYDIAYAAFEYLDVIETAEHEPFRVMQVGDKRVLDAGCAGGAYVFRALELGAREAVGVDINENYLEFAGALNANRSETRARFILDDVETMQHVDGEFDVVISRLVTPLLDLEEFIGQLTPKASLGCRLYLKTHAAGFYLRDALSYARARDALRVGRAAFALANGMLENTIHRRLTLRRGASRHKDVFYTRRYVYKTLMRHGWRVSSDSWRENRRAPFVIAERH